MKDIVYISIIAILISALWLNTDALAYTKSQHKNELNRLTDSLSKCNGVIKANQFKYPDEK